LTGHHHSNSSGGTGGHSARGDSTTSLGDMGHNMPRQWVEEGQEDTLAPLTSWLLNVIVTFAFFLEFFKQLFFWIEMFIEQLALHCLSGAFWFFGRSKKTRAAAGTSRLSFSSRERGSRFPHCRLQGNTFLKY